MINEQNIKSFFAKMEKSDELSQAGFKLLEARENPIDYFPYAMASGQFALEKFRPPQKAELENYFWIPSHFGLGYLQAVARQAVNENNEQVMKELLALIKAVSNHKPDDAKQLDNHFIWRAFLEITATLPIQYYDDELMQLVDVWLSSRFDQGVVASELPDGLLLKLINSNTSQTAKWACDILGYATKFEVVTKKLGDYEYVDLEGVIESFWLQELFKKTAVAFAKTIGRQAIQVMLERLLDVRKAGKLEPSSWYRSAIEQHPQNKRDDDHEDILLTATRDMLVTWFEGNPTDAKALFGELLNSDYTLFERFSLFLATEFPPTFDEDIINRIGKFLSSAEYHHETHRFLSMRFGELSGEKRDAVLAAIEDLTIEKPEENSDRILARDKLTWLSAISGKGSEKVEAAKSAIEKEWPKIKLTKHPDFLSWSETRRGPGPSPLSEAEILSLAMSRELVGRLNEFKESPNAWFDEPTGRALSEVLQQAIKTQPQVFLGVLDDFLEAKYAYKYSVFAAFSELRRAAKTPEDHEPWEIYWPKLVKFAREVLGEQGFWLDVKYDENAGVMEPRKTWIPAQIVDLFKHALNDDEHPIPEDLVPAVGALIVDTLDNAITDDKESSDQLNNAINNTKGRALETYIAFALSRARKVGENGREEEWNKHRPVFDKQLRECTDKNFDVSALLGQYQSHLMYLSMEWVEENFAAIFPYETYPRSFRAACSGLAYCQGMGRKISDLLRSTGALVAAIIDDKIKGHARDGIFQRLGLAIIWGDEAPNGKPISEAMRREQIDDIAGMISFISRVFDKTVEDPAKKNVRALWSVLSSWANETERRRSVSAALVGLLKYVDVLDEEATELAKLAIAKSNTPYQTVNVVEALIRLYPNYPDNVVDLLLATAAKNISYDHKNQLKDFILLVGQKYPQQAISVAMHLRSVNGMAEVIATLRAENPERPKAD